MWKLCAITNHKRRYSLDSRGNNNLRLNHETFHVLKGKEIKHHGEYRTQCLVLAAWDTQETAIARGKLSFDQQVKSGELAYALRPAAHVLKKGPVALELKRPSVPSKASASSRPSLDAQPALVTDFTPPAGSYVQKLKRVMVFGRPKTQAELAELVATLSDEDRNIHWLTGSALTILGGLPVVKLLAA